MARKRRLQEEPGRGAAVASCRQWTLRSEQSAGDKTTPDKTLEIVRRGYLPVANVLLQTADPDISLIC